MEENKLREFAGERQRHKSQLDRGKCETGGGRRRLLDLKRNHVVGVIGLLVAVLFGSCTLFARGRSVMREDVPHRAAVEVARHVVRPGQEPEPCLRVRCRDQPVAGDEDTDDDSK